MRDLIKEFDASTTQAAANANDIGLAMYGRHAITPLIERLNGGDLANIAAEKGLLLVGSNDPVVTCPMFAAIIHDKARRFPWQTHKTIVRVLGQSDCVKFIQDLITYSALLKQLGADAKAVSTFSHRYSEPAGFNGDSATSLRDEIDNALEILNAMDKP